MKPIDDLSYACAIKVIAQIVSLDDGLWYIDTWRVMDGHVSDRLRIGPIPPDDLIAVRDETLAVEKARCEFAFKSIMENLSK